MRESYFPMDSAAEIHGIMGCFQGTFLEHSGDCGGPLSSMIYDQSRWSWYSVPGRCIPPCLCLRQENRTCVLLLFWVLLFVLGLGWGGVGGHVNVPCTSYMIYCHVAKISGIFYYVTCCYAAEISSVGWGWGGVRWGGVGGHVNVPRTSYRIYCRVSVGWGWGGVGWGAC